MRAPRLRWSRPKFTPKLGTVSDTRKVRQSRKLEPWDRIERPGKISGAIQEHVERAGGSIPVSELAEVMGIARVRDFQRRALARAEGYGFVDVDDGVVTLPPDSLAARARARKAGGEVDVRVTLPILDKDGNPTGRTREHVTEGADTIARRRYSLKRRAFHNRDKAPVSKPSAAGLEAINRSHEQRQAGLAAIEERAAAAAKTKEQRKAEAFVRDRLRELGRIRLALLQDIWRDSGGDPWTIPQAVEALGCRVEELPEFDSRRFVFPAAEGAA